MNVLFVNPKFPRGAFWGFEFALWFESKRATFPPLGLLTLAALFPSKDWNKRLVDCEVKTLKDSDIAWADLICITGMIVQADDMRRIVKRCRDFGKTVVVGGPFVTTCQDSDLPNAHHILKGEVEETIQVFLEDLRLGRAKPVYDAPLERPSMALSPVPDFHLADMRRYSSMSVQWSRGCPFQCEFCDITAIYGRRPRAKRIERLLIELDVLYKLGWRGSLFIVDDNFIGDKNQVKVLLDALAQWQEDHGYPFAFLTEASVNLAQDELLLGKMRKAGFRRVFLGIETPVIASLQETKKLQNTREALLNSVWKIQSYGMEVMAGFIVGFDSDPLDVFEQQIEFIQKSRIPLAMVGMLTALPGTDLWNRLRTQGRLIGDVQGTNNRGVNFIPRMGLPSLVKGYKHILMNVYDPKQYYSRVLEFLRNAPDPEHPQPQTSGLISSALTLVRILLVMGIWDRHRRHFWWFLNKLRRLDTRKIKDGLRLLVMGYHGTKLAEAFESQEL